MKGCNSFIFRIARGVTEIDPRKSASVRNSGISRWRLISGRMGIFQAVHEKAGRCQVN